MKVNTKQLQDAMRPVLQVASGEYKYCTLKAESSILSIIASNDRTAITVKIDCENSEDQSFSIEAKKLADLSKKVSAEFLNFKETDQNIMVKAGKSSARIAKMEVTPIKPAKVEGEKLEVDFIKMMQAITVLHPYASTNEARRNMNGINFKVESGKLFLTAADGFRIARFEMEIDSDSEITATIHNKSIKEIQALTLDSATMTIGERALLVESEKFIYQTSLIETDFPNLSQVLEVKGNEIYINADQLKESIEFLGIFFDQSAPVKLGFSGQEITVSCRVQDSSETENKVSFTGELQLEKIGVALGFLNTIMQSNEGETLTAYFENETRPMFFKTLENFIFAVMPIRIKD